jgi:acetyl-CoA synthetase
VTRPSQLAAFPGPTAAFRAARDLLLDTATDYAQANSRFTWPDLREFNWALDWFDAVLAVEHAADRALWIVDPRGNEDSWTFAALSARSSQLACWLRAQGVSRGDRVLVQLGNQVELWETLLALMKLGAVAVPTSPLLGPADVASRVARTAAAHLMVSADRAGGLAALPGTLTRVAVGGQVDGWLDYDECRRAPNRFEPDGPSPADDPLLILFSPGTTGRAKAIVHTNVSYPVGHLSTMYWVGLRPGDVHLSVASPGWTKHLCGNVFTPWNAAACVLVYAAPQPSPETLLALMARCGVTTMCAPPRAWAILAGHTPGAPVTLGAIGRPLPGYPVVLVDPVTGHPAAPGEEGEICLDLRRRPLGLMAHYLDAAEPAPAGSGPALYRTGDVAVADELGYLRYLGRVEDVFRSADHRISPVELESVLAGDGPVHPPVCPYPPAALPAGSGAGVRPVALHDLGQDPPDRATRAGTRHDRRRPAARPGVPRTGLPGVPLKRMSGSGEGFGAGPVSMG